jgi:Bacterial antitoxin of type II TA system, VapB
MKTTLEITDSLLEQAKQLAAARATTLRQIVEEGLRNLIETRQEKPFHLRDGSFGGQGMVRKMSWDEIRSEIYQGRGA